MKPDLEAIRARDAVIAYEPDEDQADRRVLLQHIGELQDKFDRAIGDLVASHAKRKALLAYVAELREAAGKVTCSRCRGRGLVLGAVGDDRVPCPDCLALRRLLSEVKP